MAWIASCSTHTKRKSTISHSTITRAQVTSVRGYCKVLVALRNRELRTTCATTTASQVYTINAEVHTSPLIRLTDRFKYAPRIERQLVSASPIATSLELDFL